MSSGLGVQKSQVGACSIHGAQTGRFSTTGPRGKSWHLTLKHDLGYISAFQMLKILLACIYICLCITDKLIYLFVPIPFLFCKVFLLLFFDVDHF